MPDEINRPKSFKEVPHGTIKSKTVMYLQTSPLPCYKIHRPHTITMR